MRPIFRFLLSMVLRRLANFCGLQPNEQWRDSVGNRAQANSTKNVVRSLTQSGQYGEDTRAFTR